MKTDGFSRESLALLALVAAGAAWASRAGTLPASAGPVWGPIGVGLAWAGLYGAAALGYGAGAADRDPRHLRRRLGVAFLLTLASTQLCRILADAIVSPYTWDHLYYLKWLVPSSLVVFWCAVLLPRETRLLVRTAQASATLAPLADLAVLLLAAATLVSCADLAFEFSGSSPVGDMLDSDIISRPAWTANVVMLFGAYALVLAVTARLGAALLTVTPVYAALALASLVKIRYMHSAVQPLDLLRLPELVPFLPTFLGTVVFGALVGVMALWVAGLWAVRRTRPCPLSAPRRWGTGMLAAAALLAFPVAYFRASTIPDDVEGSLSAADALLSRFNIRGREFKEMARLRGVLMAFTAELPSAVVSAPPGYSAATVASARKRHCSSTRPEAGRPGGVNLVLYVIESFMDPLDLGLHYSSDPIPNLRALREAHAGGVAIVPEEFGGSANTEFEALTGMTTAFLPAGSVAYRMYLHRPIPSLPRALGRLGYATTAVQADPRHFYDRERAYRLLGFDRVVWLGDDPDVERDPRGWWPTDRAVVEAVIEASRGPRPAFIFAFPSSTHFPYNEGTYRDSDLDVLDAPSPEVADEVKEYINKLRVADEAIGMLVEHFRRQPDSTIIAVLGDHLPPLPERALRVFFSQLSGLPREEQTRRRRRVPLLVWANFGLPGGQTELGINALAPYLLDRMRVRPEGFLAVSDAVRREAPVLPGAMDGADGRTGRRDAAPGEIGTLLADYRLLQYDLLLGKRYSLADTDSAEWTCGSAPAEQAIRR